MRLLLTENLNIHKGKTFSHFENANGKKLTDLNGRKFISIVFTDGTKVNLGREFRGNETYISQYTNNDDRLPEK